MIKSDEYYMMLALEQAKLAAQFDEVPVGAVIVKDGEVIASAANMKERQNCAIYHAEMVAIEEASRRLDNWYLDGCTLFVTLEPCVMCCGGIINSRIDRVVYGASDEKSGGISSVYSILSDGKLNHKPSVTGGVLEQQCSSILTEFFKRKRETKKAEKAAKKNTEIGEKYANSRIGQP